MLFYEVLVKKIEMGKIEDIEKIEKFGLNKAVTEVRSGKELKKEWKADIEADYQQRNKK